MERLEPSYQKWLTYVQQPGVPCVDETTYCIDGIKYWLWVAFFDSFYALLLAPTRSSAELKQFGTADFSGIREQRSALVLTIRKPPQRAQKCLAPIASGSPTHECDVRLSDVKLVRRHYCRV